MDNLTTKTGKGSSLTPTELDNNWTTIETAIEVLEVNVKAVDDFATIQAAFDWLLINGGVLNFTPGTTYTPTSALTILRDAADDAQEYVINGNGATLDFSASGLTSGNALTIGASSTTYFLEDGSIVIRDLALRGPETGSPSGGDDPTTTLIGLSLEIAGRVTLDNVQVTNFYTGIKSLWAFPLVGQNVGVRNNYVGLHLDEVSNHQRWINLHANQCRYGVLLKAASTSLDNGKIYNVAIESPWVETCRVGFHLDSGSHGSGDVLFRGITITDPYISGVEYDVIRAGLVYTFATPQTRGANAADFIIGLRITDGIWNGTWDATHAAIVFASTGRVRETFIDIPVDTLETNGYVFVSAPGGGTIRMRATPNTGNTGKVTEYLYNQDGSRARILLADGSLWIATSKSAASNINQVGIELGPTGTGWFTAEGNPVLRLNRTNTAGTVVALYKSNTLVGGIDTHATNGIILNSNGDLVSVGGAIAVPDGINAPTNITGLAVIYVDVSDGDLKVKFADGVTKVLAADT